MKEEYKDDWGVAEGKDDGKAAVMKESEIHIVIDPDKTRDLAAQLDTDADIELVDQKHDTDDPEEGDEGVGGKRTKQSDSDKDEVTQC